MTSRKTLLVLGALLALSLSGQALAQSQAIERNEPAAVPSSSSPLTLGAEDFGSDDESPLGVDLRGVRLIGLAEPVPPRPSPGIGIGEVAEVSAAAVEAALSPFLGQPLSLAQITRMQAALAGVWREAGYPFMSVTVPPQEVTSGVLVLRVVEFVAGDVALAAGAAAHNQSLTSRLRQQKGTRIDAKALEEDLDWINRNPFRRVEAELSPGNALGASDITLAVREEMPVSGAISWSNSGSEATGRDRWSLEGAFWAPGLNDLVVSYRFTRGGEIENPEAFFGLDPDRPSYLSHSARFDLQTLPRQALSFAPNQVESREFVDGTPFSFHNRTLEVPILYRTAISNFTPGHYLGDAYFGIEPKWLSRTTYFGGVDLGTAEVGLFNFVAGWSHGMTDRHGRTDVDLRIKANPGGIVEGNTVADWLAFTGGRVTDHTYAYLGVDVARTTSLPGDIVWISDLNGILADRPLPDSERLGLGGHQAVRGYDLADASVDTGFVWRNEFRGPPLSPLAGAGTSDRLSPFAFVDLGAGHDYASGLGITLASAGLGVDYALEDHLTANLTAAVPLLDGAHRIAGEFSLLGNVRVSW